LPGEDPPRRDPAQPSDPGVWAAAVRSRTAAVQVEAARKAGATWIEIGACYGLTKQGAQQRFRAARNQAKAAAAVPGSEKSEPAV
jgi:hypothetical protein